MQIGSSRHGVRDAEESGEGGEDEEGEEGSRAAERVRRARVDTGTTANSTLVPRGSVHRYTHPSVRQSLIPTLTPFLPTLSSSRTEPPALIVSLCPAGFPRSAEPH